MADGKKRKGARKGRLEDLITPFREPQTRIPAVAFVASTAGLALLFSERNALSPWPIFWAIPVLALFSLAYMSNFSQNLSLVCCVILEMRIRDIRFSIIPNYPQGHSIDWLIAVVIAIQAGSFYRLHRLNELVQQ